MPKPIEGVNPMLPDASKGSDAKTLGQIAYEYVNDEIQRQQTWQQACDEEKACWENAAMAVLKRAAGRMIERDANGMTPLHSPSIVRDYARWLFSGAIRGR